MMGTLGGGGALAANAACILICPPPTPPVPSPTPSPTPAHSPSPSPHPTPSSHPSPRPTPRSSPQPPGNQVTGGGGGPVLDVIQPVNPGDAVGAVPGPPPPPTITPTSMEISADPASPQAGQPTTLTVVTAGSDGGNKYGIRDVPVTLVISDAPDKDAKLDPTTITTDASGSASSKFTLSKRKGKNVVTATAGSLSTAFNVDTLLGSAGTPTRGRHTGAIDPVQPTPHIAAAWLFALAALIVVLSFGFPYRRGLLREGKALRERVGLGSGKLVPVNLADVNLAAGESWRPSSKKRIRERPKSAARGG